MMTLSHDQATSLLNCVIMDANDIRDGYSNKSYAESLSDAFAVTGIKPDKTPSEGRAKAIINRAGRAAKGVGIFGDRRPPARAVVGVLRAAASGRRAGR